MEIVQFGPNWVVILMVVEVIVSLTAMEKPLWYRVC